MKKILLIVSTLSFFLLGSALLQTPHISYAEKNTDHEENHHHFIEKGDLQRLLEQGYSKKDILKAAHIAKYTDKNVDEVLKSYKENDSSWEKTAGHYGLDLEKLKKKCHKHKEKFLEENKETIIKNVAEYSGKTEKDIQSWLDEGVSLRFIVRGAAMAKASNKDLAELIKLHLEGQSYKDLKMNLHIDREKMHTEMMVLMKKIKEDIKN